MVDPVIVLSLILRTEVKVSFIPTLQVRKLRCGEISQIAQDEKLVNERTKIWRNIYALSSTPHFEDYVFLYDVKAV